MTFLTMLALLKTLGKKYLGYILIFLVLCIAIYYVYNSGYDSGYNEAKEQWDEYKKEQNLYIASLEEMYEQSQEKYNQEKESLVVQVHKTELKYNSELIDLELDYVNRLRESEARADYYQRMSESSTGVSTSLANYTAQFDKTITEGQHLVRELTETIKLRDDQLRQCGKQIELILGVYNGK